VYDELRRCYDLLGVAPGASAREVKTAYRDLTKVWHPDRFTHDPSLQQKAQEKLKEINEAYAQVLAGKTGRAPNGPAHAPRPTHTPARPNVRRTRRPLVILPALVFGIVFVVATRTLVTRRAPPSAPAPVAQTQAPPAEDARAEDAQAAAAVEPPRGAKRPGAPAPRGAGLTSRGAAVTNALPTVTVMIDPATGLLATPACPHKIRMTYPSGDEPHQLCNAAHKPPRRAAGRAPVEGQP
jgi:hypothetical protein